MENMDLTFPILIGSEIYRNSVYGMKHPLSIPRVSLTLDLIDAFGWKHPHYLEGREATDEELGAFHDPQYIRLVRKAQLERLTEAESLASNIGRNGNPVFPEVFSRPATACGSSIMAADIVREGGVVFSPAGGTHHGMRGQASGFCYFNDPVLAILKLLDNGMGRVVYVDLDAHHGDGVEAVFSNDERVTLISVHEEGRWPNTGQLKDRGCGNVYNLPVPQGYNDSEFSYVLENLILPVIHSVRPDALVVQNGVDSLHDDPLSRLSLSNNCYSLAASMLKREAASVIFLGGGGYNPFAVARAWTAIWGALAGYDAPEVLPKEAEAVLRDVSWRHSRGRNPPDHWYRTLHDAPASGPIRAPIRERVAFLMTR